MNLSPLQLKHYHFTGISLMARPSANPSEADFDAESYPIFNSEDLTTIVSLGELENDTDPHQFVVLLGISCEPKDTSNFPYTFALSIEGVFVITHDGSIDERKKLVVCNGASMLYGAAREVLLSLSARHKHGPMLLPSANFNGLGPSSSAKKEMVLESRRSTKKKVKNT